MRTSLWTFTSVLVLGPAGFAAAGTCPPYTIPAADRCELDSSLAVDGRLTLPETLLLSTDTHLDCKGLVVVPEATGTPDVRGTAANEQVRSTPEVAVVIKQGAGATVENCRFDAARPFDFAVLVLDSRTGVANRVVNNELAGRYGGAIVVRSNDTWIAGNQIRFGIQAHGRGVGIYRDSDRNVVRDNLIEAHSVVNRTNLPFVPQSPPREANSRGIFGSALNTGVLNFVYGGELIQVPLTADMIASPLKSTWLGTCRHDGTCTGSAEVGCRDDRDCGLSAESMTSAYLSEGNVYEGNTIRYLRASMPAFGNGAFRTFGIVDIGSTGTAITANVLGGDPNEVNLVDEGIHFGAAGHDNSVLAGTCSADPGRWCASDADCIIPGFGDKGVCAGSWTLRNVNIGATSILVAGNLVSGAASYGILLARGSQSITVTGNTISGADSAIGLRQNAPESSIVTRNLTHGNRYDLALDDGAFVLPFSRARHYRSTVSLNDFTGATKQAIAAGACSNFQQVLSCADHDDCNNSCSGGRCLRTGQTCSSDTPCGGANAVGTCVAAFTRFDAKLSSQGSGNFWGRTCDDSDGFRDAGEPDADSPSSSITDNHPYGRSVALTADHDLPHTVAEGYCTGDE